MLTEFFQFGSLPADQIYGTYDDKLVLLSYIVATFASFIALDIAGRLRDENITANEIIFWLSGGAFAMGAGIWSMHFIGMLAFKMTMPVSYDPLWTAISMLVAILASFFALFLLKAQRIDWRRLASGGVMLGLAIATMHYTGMHAMNGMTIHYLPGLFFLSIVIAIVASEAALWFALNSNKGELKTRIKLKIISAIIMGAAICGMHYTGMAAAVFTVSANMTAFYGNNLNPQILSIIIAIVTFFILGVAFFLSAYKEIKNQQLITIARLAGMTEVATNVLHNVGNVLNSISVSADQLMEKTANTRLNQLEDISLLLQKHKSNLQEFMLSPQGSLLPEFFSELTKVWKVEQQRVYEELNQIIKNIQHIKDIISTQQSLNYVETKQEQRVTLAGLIEESILVTGVDLAKHGITIQKNIMTHKSFYIDKIKIMQILVNLIKNAKEALGEMPQGNKNIIINAKKVDHVYIEIIDNGIGIPPENVVRIFVHGFTTKKTGHGFGLHTSAILAKQLGGSVRVESKGWNKGSKFILEVEGHE